MYYLNPIYPDTLRIELTNLSHQLHPLNPCYRIYMLIKEKADLMVGTTACHYNDYDVFFVMPGESLSPISDSDPLLLCLKIEQEYMRSALPEVDKLISNLRGYSSGELEPLRPAFAALAKSSFSPAANSRYHYGACFYNFLFILSNLIHPDESKADDNRPSDERRLDRVDKIRQYIEVNFNKPLTMNDLADSLFLTPQYLSKFIKEQLGSTFIHYLNGVRLRHAVEELLRTDHSITQIAFGNGFPNLTAFNKVFRDTYQETPLKYRQSLQENKIIVEKAVQAESVELSPEVRLFAQNQLERLIDRYEHVSQLPKSTGKQRILASIFSPEPLVHAGFEMINLGFAVNILSHSFQEQLTGMQKDFHFKYARFQGIIEPEIIDKIPNTDQYNFSNANRIIDFLYSIDLLPFIEIGPKPRKFNANYHNYVYLSSSAPVFRNVEEQIHFINRFIHHCINRYGLSEVEKWQFEQWLPHGMHLEYTQNEIQDFIINYRNLYSTIKSLLPNARVGGFGFNLTKSPDILMDVYGQLKRAGLKLDFMSLTTFHIQLPDHPESNIPYMTTDPNYLPNRISQLYQLLPDKDMPLVIAEWNFDFTARNYLNDSIFKALFVTKNILETVNPIHSLGYWLFSDISSEYKDTTKMLFGGNGLVTIDGIKKPSYYAYKFISQLGRQVIKKGEGYIITANSPDTYTILLYHYVHPSDFFCFRYDTEIYSDNVNDIFEAVPPRDYEIELTDITPGRYRVKTYTLSKEHGSILDEWNRMGAIQNVSPNEITYFSNITVPSQSIRYASGEDKLLIQDRLERNEIHLLSVRLEI